LRGVVAGRRREQRRERRLELGLGIGLAVRGREEAPAVDQAGVAGAEQVGAVVAEIEPFPPRRQLPGARPLDQLGQIIRRRRCGVVAGPEGARDQRRGDSPGDGAAPVAAQASR
jgi:hypothetical protein